MEYEALLVEADNEGLTVKEMPMRYNNGRIKGNKIAIREDIDTSTEKTCILAEELGHHHTSVGNILDMENAQNRKQERQARLWGYNKLIGLSGLIRAYEAGCRSGYEIAEHLEVTEECLTECIEAYRDKYGVGVEVDNFYIMFIPHLAVGKVITAEALRSNDHSGIK